MKYDLSTPAAIKAAAIEARTRAGNEYNQNSYNAAWLHGYADALREVAAALTAEKHYAETRWSWEDVQEARPDWDEMRCRSWWIGNQKWFRDALTEHGNEILHNIIDE